MYGPETADPEHPLNKLAGSDRREIFGGFYQNILLAGEAEPLKSVLICAANQGEGATTVALGLALAAVEQQGEPVLLIDGVFHAPRVCEAFGLPAGRGLGDLIAGRANLGDAIRKSGIPDLWVMGPGVVRPGYLKNLRPPMVRGLMAQLAQEYSLVIVDGPAINLFPESGLYAPQVDRTFLVVHSGVTRVPVVSRALAKLAAQKGVKVEIILNRRTFNIPEWIYKKL